MTTHPALTGEQWIPDTDSFGARLALLRHHMGWNIAQAARECGFAEASWREWELNGAIPRKHRDVALQIYAVTGAHLAWLQGYPVHQTRRADRQTRDMRARRDSNPQPSDPKVAGSDHSAVGPTHPPKVPPLTEFDPQNSRESRESALGGAA